MKLTTAAFLLAVAAAHAQDLDAGRKSFQRCNGCHAAPDLTQRADKLWLGMISTSA
jgi:cytochrome c2